MIPQRTCVWRRPLSACRGDPSDRGRRSQWAPYCAQGTGADGPAARREHARGVRTQRPGGAIDKPMHRRDRPMREVSVAPARVRQEGPVPTADVLARFLASAAGQAAREGRRYAADDRVQALTVTGNLASAAVRGRRGEPYEVALWVEGGELLHRCSCPSWRDPCKHIVAVACVVRCMTTGEPGPGAGQVQAPTGSVDREAAEDLDALAASAARALDVDAARADAMEERVCSARAERARVVLVEGDQVEVQGKSAFPALVTVRGDVDGPHGCSCPDFEANRLHTCKHVERVRTYLRRRRKPLPRAYLRASRRPRVYLHFGEIVEPRLFGTPKGRGAPALRAAFDRDGIRTEALDPDPRATAAWLRTFGAFVEPGALRWLDARADAVPRYPAGPRLALAALRRRGLTPYDYQRTGALFLARQGRALLADEMGLGKTVQAILAAVTMRRAREPVETVTVVCPASLRGGWQDEIGRWAGEDATLLQGNAIEREGIIAARPKWLITHYEQVLRDHEAHRAAPPDLLIVDEAQRAKGLMGKTARALKAIPSRYLFALTGTPLENRLEEAYAIAQLVDQRLLPPLWQIERDHFVRDPDRPRAVVMYRDLGAIRARLAPAFLRRRKEDVLPDLPECVEVVSRLPMHPEVEPTYEDTIAQVAKILRMRVLRPGDLERLQRLFVIARRCCNGPHMLGVDVADHQVPKLRELREALQELCLGEQRKVVVFSEWTDMTDRVEALAVRLGVPVFHLKGSVPVSRRQAMIDSFSNTAGPAVFVSTDAGGVGLNLQAADAVVNLDLPWNPARLAQRVARVHRIGTSETVRVILLVTSDSIEDRMLGLHKTKRDVLENVWAQDGEEHIAAPGGSGALQAMLRDLIADVLEHQGGSENTLEDAQDPRVASQPEDPVATGSAVPIGGGARSLAVPRPGDEPVAVGSAHGSPSPQALARAVADSVASIAPTLPSEHRRSLAAVFGALAAALSDDDLETMSPATDGTYDAGAAPS